MYRTDKFREAVRKEADRWMREGRHIPSQNEIDAVTQTLSVYRKQGVSDAVLKGVVLPCGITFCEISEDFVIVYWEGDPAAKAFVAAGIEDLPEFLVCNDSEIRKLARQKFEALISAEQKEGDGKDA